VEPRAIAFCETTADVAQVVRFARARGWPVAGRGGRHSFAGYSNVPGGIVADVSRIDGVVLERDRPVVRIGGGANVLDVYRDLVLAHGRALSVGTCPMVGIAGLTLGGGFGPLMRRYGITSDSLRAATVVLADGSVAHCSEDRRADLSGPCAAAAPGSRSSRSCASPSASRPRRRSCSRCPTPGRRPRPRSTPGSGRCPMRPRRSPTAACARCGGPTERSR
jgi:FAD/FMN-containing dehydrogenase